MLSSYAVGKRTFTISEYVVAFSCALKYDKPEMQQAIALDVDIKAHGIN